MLAWQAALVIVSHQNSRTLSTTIIKLLSSKDEKFQSHQCKLRTMTCNETKAGTKEEKIWLKGYVCSIKIYLKREDFNFSELRAGHLRLLPIGSSKFFCIIAFPTLANYLKWLKTCLKFFLYLYFKYPNFFASRSQSDDYFREQIHDYFKDGVLCNGQ